MQQRSKGVCAELEQRSRGNRRSWWEPDRSKQDLVEDQGAEEVQELTSELAALRPKVEEEAQRLQGVTQMIYGNANLGQSGGITCGWHREEEHTCSHGARVTSTLTPAELVEVRRL